jgi:hypothetical protein
VLTVLSGFSDHYLKGYLNSRDNFDQFHGELEAVPLLLLIAETYEDLREAVALALKSNIGPQSLPRLRLDSLKAMPGLAPSLSPDSMSGTVALLSESLTASENSLKSNGYYFYDGSQQHEFAFGWFEKNVRPVIRGVLVGFLYRLELPLTPEDRKRGCEAVIKYTRSTSTSLRALEIFQPATEDPAHSLLWPQIEALAIASLDASQTADTKILATAMLHNMAACEPQHRPSPAVTPEAAPA